MTVPSELKTIRDMLRLAVTELSKAGVSYGHGTNNPLDEAVSLISYCLNLTSEIFEQFLDSIDKK